VTKTGARILALVTDAYGAGGGIAQYNRDIIGALASWPSVGSIEVLPRLGVARPGQTPPGARQYAPVRHPIAYSLKAFALALRRRPDIVFCGHLFMAPLAFLVARLRGAKLVVQTHGVEIWPRPGPLRRGAVEAADLVLCVSRDTSARLRGWAAMAPERVTVLPNTVAEVYAPGDGAALRAELGLEGKIVLLTVSRLDAGQRYKGQDRVIGLIGPLRRQGYDVVYLICGKGDDRPRLEALAGYLGVTRHVRFLGEAPYAMLPDLYRAADLYCMPSSGEGFGIVFLEAMACGLPAIGLALGGAPDALRDGVAVSPERFEAALLGALSRKKPDATELSAKVRARYGRPAFVARAHMIFDRLIGGWPE
jgi:phosphatidylinositol alpha-1,6-mannosyltransferase